MKQVTLLFLVLCSFIADSQILDASFNQTGKNKDILYKRLDFMGVAVSHDQSIIIAGPDLDTLSSHYKQVKVMKLKPNGTPDSSFGSNGISYFQFDTVFTDVQGKIAVSIQSGNDIVLNGTYHKPTTGPVINTKHFWTRLHPDGSLDTSYANHGIGDISVPGISFFYSPQSAIVLPNNDIIVLLRNSANHLMKLTSNGFVDSTFGVNGFSTFVLTQMTVRMDLKAQADGKLLVYGNSSGFNNNNILIRYLADGSIDSSFAMNGIYYAKIDSVNSGLSVLPLADGSIYCTGYYTDTVYSMSVSGDTCGGFIQRLKSNGDPDTSFNHTGLVRYQHPVLWPGNVMKFVGIHIVNGKLIVTGCYQTGTPQLNYCLLRYNPDGSLDSTFGTNGLYLTYETDSVDWCYQSIMQNADKVLLIGESRHNTLSATNTGFIARYLLNFAAGLTTKESQLKTSIECYPNPATNTIYVQYFLNQTQEVTLSIIDVNGRVVKRIFSSQKQIPQTYQYKIDVSDLHKNQLYLVDLASDGRHQTTGFVLKQ